MDWGELRSKLPLGRGQLPGAMPSFTGLRSGDWVYVDKTSYVQLIAERSEPQVLARPPRFGKSMLVSTLEELFLHGTKPYDGHASYFEGLAIEHSWHDEGQYLVLRLNLALIDSGCATVANFEQSLMRAVAAFCYEHKITLPEAVPDCWEQFCVMLEQVPERSLVLLIDDYDAPLLNHFEDEAERKVCQLVLRCLFFALKSYRDKFRCVFMTGVTRLADLDLGTAAYGIRDVSYDVDLAECCGYTRSELKQYFSEHLRYSAAVWANCKLEAVNASLLDSILYELQSWYGGFSFARIFSHEVTSPWSILSFLSDEEARFQSYWKAEPELGYPKLLRLTIDKINVERLFKNFLFKRVKVDSDTFEQSSLSHPEVNPYGVLFHAGYLSFCEPYRPGAQFYLMCPNKEVDQAYVALLPDNDVKVEGRPQVVSQVRERTSVVNQVRELTPVVNQVWDGTQVAAGDMDKVTVLSSLDPELIRAHFNQVFKECLRYETIRDGGPAFVWNCLSIYLATSVPKPRFHELSPKGSTYCEIDLPKQQLTIVFELAFTTSSDPKKLDRKLAKALKRLSTKGHGLNSFSAAKVARFALVFCAAPGECNFARVVRADVITQ